MTRARDLFEEIRSGGYAFIQHMIDESYTEEFFLDYKRCATTGSFSKLEDSDIKNYSKAISGFGNSDGGVVVWGVDCRPNRDEQDADVPTAAPLEHPIAFKTALDSRTSGATLPPHGGVENICVVNEESNKGFVVTLIPESNQAPLQSVAHGDCKYYMRAGSSFSPISHGVLAGMFGRKPNPNIVGRMRLLSVSPVGSRQSQWRMIVKNGGRGLAEDVHVMLSFAKQGVKTTVSAMGEDYWTVRTQGTKHDNYTCILLSTDKLRRFLPGEEANVCDLSIEFPELPQSGFTMDVTFGSSSSAPSTTSISLSQNMVQHIGEVLFGASSMGSDAKGLLTAMFTRGLSDGSTNFIEI